jgi:hypothetical protein
MQLVSAELEQDNDGAAIESRLARKLRRAGHRGEWAIQQKVRNMHSEAINAAAYILPVYDSQTSGDNANADQDGADDTTQSVVLKNKNEKMMANYMEHRCGDWIKQVSEWRDGKFKKAMVQGSDDIFKSEDALRTLAEDLDLDGQSTTADDSDLESVEDIEEDAEDNEGGDKRKTRKTRKTQAQEDIAADPTLLKYCNDDAEGGDSNHRDDDDEEDETLVFDFTSEDVAGPPPLLAPHPPVRQQRLRPAEPPHMFTHGMQPEVLGDLEEQDEIILISKLDELKRKREAEAFPGTTAKPKNRLAALVRRSMCGDIEISPTSSPSSPKPELENKGPPRTDSLAVDADGIEVKSPAHAERQATSRTSSKTIKTPEVPRTPKKSSKEPAQSPKMALSVDPLPEAGECWFEGRDLYEVALAVGRLNLSPRSTTWTTDERMLRQFWYNPNKKDMFQDDEEHQEIIPGRRSIAEHRRSVLTTLEHAADGPQTDHTASLNLTIFQPPTDGHESSPLSPGTKGASSLPAFGRVPSGKNAQKSRQSLATTLQAALRNPALRGQPSPKGGSQYASQDGIISEPLSPLKFPSHHAFSSEDSGPEMEDADTQTTRPSTPKPCEGYKIQSTQTDKVQFASCERDEESKRKIVRRVPQKLGMEVAENVTGSVSLAMGLHKKPMNQLKRTRPKGSHRSTHTMAGLLKRAETKQDVGKEDAEDEKDDEAADQGTHSIAVPVPSIAVPVPKGPAGSDDGSSSGSRSSSRSSSSGASDHPSVDSLGESEVDPSSLFYSVIDCSLGTELTWPAVPEVLVSWLKMNLFQKQQAELYCGEWLVTEIQHFDNVTRQEREKMIEDFEHFLLDVMCMVRPGKHEQRRGLRQRYRRIAKGEKDQVATSDEEGQVEGLDESPSLKKLEEEPAQDVLQASSMLDHASSTKTLLEHVSSTTDLKPLMHIQSAVSLQSIQSAVSLNMSVSSGNTANIASAATLPALSPTGFGSIPGISARSNAASLTSLLNFATLEEGEPSRPSTSGTGIQRVTVADPSQMAKLTSSQKNLDMQGVGLGPLGQPVLGLVGSRMFDQDSGAVNLSDILGFQPPEAQFKDASRLPVLQDPFCKPYASDQGVRVLMKADPDSPESPRASMPEPEPAPSDDDMQDPKQVHVKNLVTDRGLLPFDEAPQPESDINLPAMPTPAPALTASRSARNLPLSTPPDEDEGSVAERVRRCEILAQRLTAMRQHGLRGAENEVNAWLADLDAVDPHAVAQIQAVEAATGEAGQAQFQQNLADVHRRLKELIKGAAPDNHQLIDLSRRLIGHDAESVEVVSSALRSLVDISIKRKNASECLLRFAFNRLKRLRGTLPSLPSKMSQPPPTWTQSNLRLVSRTSEKTPRQGASQAAYSPSRDKTTLLSRMGDSRPSTRDMSDRPPRQPKGNGGHDFIGSIAWSYSKSPSQVSTSGSLPGSGPANRSSSLSQPSRSRMIVGDQPVLMPGGGLQVGGSSSERGSATLSRFHGGSPMQGTQYSRPQTSDATPNTARRLCGGLGNITHSKKSRWSILPDSS